MFSSCQTSTVLDRYFRDLDQVFTVLGSFAALIVEHNRYKIPTQSKLNVVIVRNL